ncbi:MAG TPA: hypothetical protein VF867_01295 [Arthrobacter sp.]
MTTNSTQSRVLPGVPSGGEFTAVGHSDNVQPLEAPVTKTVTEFFLERDEIRARRERLQEQAINMDQLAQAYSVRGIGALAIARFPGAATLKIAENPEGENQFDVIAILDAKGNILHHVDEDDDFVNEEMVQYGPTLQELVWDLNVRDDSWAGGVAVVTGTRKRDCKSADIDLAAAKNAPIPFIAAENNPRTRSLSEDEQADLVEAANHGMTAIEDILEDPNSFDEHRQFEDLEGLKTRVNTLLTVTTQD